VIVGPAGAMKAGDEVVISAVVDAEEPSDG
jgi:hypothetical protein